MLKICFNSKERNAEGVVKEEMKIEIKLSRRGAEFAKQALEDYASKGIRIDLRKLKEQLESD